MALRFAILGSLAKAPASGYDLVRRFDRKLNFIWWASQGAIYTELHRLVDDGLVTVTDRGSRGRQEHEVSPAGLAEVRAWLASEPARRPRDELILRVFHLWLLDPEEAATYLDRLADDYERRLAEYRWRESEAGEPDLDDGPAVFDLIALRAGLAHESAMGQWAREAAITVRASIPARDGTGSVGS